MLSVFLNTNSTTDVYSLAVRGINHVTSELQNSVLILTSVDRKGAKVKLDTDGR